MSYRDDKFGELFPTRTGEATGTANERKMLDVLGGSESFKTRIETVNGVETMLRTRDGMPCFSSTIPKAEPVKPSTKPLQSRTFVFADRFAPTIGIVANLGPGGTLVRVGEPIEARQMVCYSVLDSKTAKAGMKPVRWNDVLRLDNYGTAIGNRVRFNSDANSPEYLTNYGERTVPGFPMEVGGVLYVANDWYLVSDGSTYVDKMGVVEYNSTTGAVAAFHPVVGETLGFLIDFVSGIYVKDGTFDFYWYGANPTLYGGAQLSCHTSITPVAGSAPVIEHHQTVTTMPSFDPSGLVYSPQTVTVSDKVVGSYYATQQRSFAGEHGPLNQYNYSFWVGSDEPAAPRDIYTAVSNTSWASSINKTDTLTVGYGMAQLEVTRSVTGSEAWTTIGGSGGSSPSSRYYVLSSGNNSEWSRTTSSTLRLHHAILDVDLFSVDFAMVSDMSFGEFREVESCTYDYSQWDRSPNKLSFGGYYSPDNPAGTAISRSQVAAAVEQFNATMLANASSIIPPDFSSRGYGVTHTTTTTSVGDATGVRHDNHTLTVRSRDYIYLDLDEDVVLYLDGTFTESRGDTSSPPITITNDGGYDTFNSEFTIEYVLEFRGTTLRFPVYHHIDTANSGAMWSAFLNLGSIWQSDIYIPSANQRFSLAHLPQDPEPVFTPLYTCQNRCPWMAYTTKAEEAAGATPELYIDAEFSALAYGHTSTAGWVSPMEKNVTFAAHHLTRILSNYLGYYAPSPDAWDTILFPTSTRIQYATGLSSPWTAAIGAPFDAASRVTITRI